VVVRSAWQESGRSWAAVKVARSVPRSRYCQISPFAFLFVPRSPWGARVAEVHINVGRDLEVDVRGRLLALVPRQLPRQLFVGLDNL